MTDRQRLLVALLSEADSTERDIKNMRLLELMAILDLAGSHPLPRAS
jgi:hypothetical protein